MATAKFFDKRSYCSNYISNIIHFINKSEQQKSPILKTGDLIT